MNAIETKQLTETEAYELGFKHGAEMARESGSAQAGAEGWDGMLINADSRFVREAFGWDGIDSTEEAKQLLRKYAEGCQAGADAEVAVMEAYKVEVHSLAGWTTHSEHADYESARDQADMVHGRLRVDQGVTCVMDREYDLDSLDFAGWLNDDGEYVECVDGLHYADYFRDGRYLGADADGVQPLFRDAE